MGRKETKIGLVEIGDAFGGQYYLPYSLGILRAYAEKYLSPTEDYAFLPFIYKREGMERCVNRLSGADIVFFSTYLWNFHTNLEIARKIKTQLPEIITVFGGPQIPASKEMLSVFLRKYPSVDIASFGEGERAFLRIIEQFRYGQWDAVPSIAYRRSDTVISLNEFKEPIRDINDIPSPYLSGVFDELLMQNPNERWQGKIETNRGCPFTCAFCYWGKKSEKKLKQFDLDRIHREIDWFAKNKIEFVFCCDANFGILKRDFDIAKKVADKKRVFGYPKAFSVQNTKNSNEKVFALQKILNNAGLQKGVNLALQSLNEETLKHIARSNINNTAYAELQKLFTESGIPTFTDLIIGLPGETYESFTNGVSEIIANGQHNRIQFINLTILENTLMAIPEYQQEHGFTVTETELIPHHSSLDTHQEIVEKQYLVTATQALPKRDWVRARVFSWMASLLHFDKLLQIPFVVLHEIYGISYKSLVETFMRKVKGQEMLADILSVFEKRAADIQTGGSEYSSSREWLNIAWYPDELTLITMSAEGRIEDFYTEAEERLLSLTPHYLNVTEPAIISQAIRLNRVALKQPFITEDTYVQSNYNIWEIYQAALRGEHTPLEKGIFEYVVDRSVRHWTSWEEWCRDVIWYGNKKGDYMYTVKRPRHDNQRDAYSRTGLGQMMTT